MAKAKQIQLKHSELEHIKRLLEASTLCKRNESALRKICAAMAAKAPK